jgi:Glycosyl hydrolases family 2/Glycosyl hydrolases family 2, sugar binding domain/Glycosyl hydrolases family 2, TIM barrel domain
MLAVVLGACGAFSASARSDQLVVKGGRKITQVDPRAVRITSDSMRTRWAADVSQSDPLPEYPRPQLTRSRWLDLNGTWQFQPTYAGSRLPSSGPLSRRILVPYPPESELSGIGRHYDRMWYRRGFGLPRGWLMRSGCSGHPCRILLHFGAVAYSATVYVNGTLVATHLGGYDAFTVDVTRALRAGVAQELVVGVSDPVEYGPADRVIGKQRVHPRSPIEYQPSSGIWQTVWVEPVASDHIVHLTMSPDLTTDTLGLTVTSSGGDRVIATAYEGSRSVSSVSGPPGATLRVPVPAARLWTPDRPFLYRLKVTLRSARRNVDQVSSYFGMRQLKIGELDGQPHLLLNGRFVFELGVLDQGYWPDGVYTAPTDAAARSDLVEAKALGFNTVRVHMNVEPDRFYYWADRLGLLLWQDMPAMARPPSIRADMSEFESELHGMIEQLSDHPSIVMWVPFNEGWGEYDPGRIAGEVKAWDPTRLVDSNSGQNCCASLPSPGNGDVYDIHSYSNPRYPNPSSGRAPTAGQAIVLGEFGGLGMFVPGHSWSDHWFSYEPEQSTAQLATRYVQELSALRALKVGCGLSGAIYTELYDVQAELDGLESYDRAVLKVDAAWLLAANRSVLAAAPGTLASGSCSPAGA